MKSSNTGDICVIYQIINCVNNKMYIGQTWQSLAHRFWEHCYRNGCPKLYNAIQKHGKENFKITAIFSITTQEDADYYEDYFINKYDSIKTGYNIKGGGRGGKHSEATKKKISAAILGDKNPNFGKPMSEDQKQKLSVSRKGKYVGEKSWGFGKKRLPETVQKMSAAFAGEKNWSAKLNEQQVIEILRLLSEGKRNKDIAILFNISSQTICSINCNKTWKHIPRK